MTSAANGEGSEPAIRRLLHDFKEVSPRYLSFLRPQVLDLLKGKHRFGASTQSNAHTQSQKVQVISHPLQDVVAQPTEDDLFIWHGNGEPRL